MISTAAPSRPHCTPVVGALQRATRVCGGPHACMAPCIVQRAARQRCAAATEEKASFGPEPPPDLTGKPEWVKALYEDAEYDDDVKDLLEGTGADPEKIRKKMNAYMDSKLDDMYQERLGSYKPMRVNFREVDCFNLWIWFQMYSAPSEREKELLNTVLKSWFMLGKLGGFNTMNMQVFHSAEDDVSYMEYDAEEQDESTLGSFFHAIGEVESKGEWCRVNVDMGTADELALDVLINALGGFSRDHVGIRRLVVGGTNSDWPTPEREIPKVSIDPMRVSVPDGEGMDDSQYDFADLDDSDVQDALGDDFSIEDVNPDDILGRGRGF